MSSRLKVDWIRCEAHGLCAEVLPEAIALDEWGYPVLDDAAVQHRLLPLAKVAVQMCPTMALRLQTEVVRPAQPSARP